MAKSVDVYEVGFGMGVQGLPVDPALSKHASDWDSARANHKKVHESQIAVLTDRLESIEDRDLPQAEATFDVVRERVKKCPSRFAASLLLLMAVAAILLDAFMIAPSFELLFAQHIEQLAVALVVLVFSTVLLHASWKSTENSARRQRYMGIVGCVFVGLLLIITGLQRGRVAGGDGLATTFFVLATLVTPVAGAWCSVTGVGRLKDASHWHQAEKMVKGLRARREATEAEVKTAKVHLVRGDEEIVAQREAHAHGLQMGHDAGKLGVTREPLTHVILKAAVAGILVLMIAALLPVMSLVSSAAALAVAGIAFVYFNNRRNHPDDRHLSQRRTVAFTPESRVFSVKPRRLLFETDGKEAN